MLQVVSIALRGGHSAETIEQLRELFQSHPGSERVCFLVESGGRLRRVETDYAVARTPQLLDELSAIVGRQNVVAPSS